MNSVNSKLSSSPECELKKKTLARPLHLSTSDGEEDATDFAEEPLGDAEWMAEYERERKADEKMEKT